ncbi:MAG: hypothetical protein IKT99_07645 [Oscillospiraceae bacterium]|nr:hypothetical protein [Oscillospiraceae bacterium]
MLSKSIKHEFRATARVMLPVFIALLSLSVVTHLTTRFFLNSDTHWVLSALGVCMVVLFFLGIAAVAFSVFALTIVRFYRSFLSEQGYLTLSLPVSTNTHIFSRLLVAVVWYTLSALAIMAAISVLALGVDGVSSIFGAIGDILRGLAQAWASLTGGQRAMALLLGFEMLVSVVASCAASCLLLYAAMAVGHSFNRHKKALSVLFAFLFYHAVQILMFLGVFAVTMGNMDIELELDTPTAVLGAGNIFFAIIIVVELAIAAVFYFITHHFLTKKLNLE